LWMMRVAASVGPGSTPWVSVEDVVRAMGSPVD